MAYKDVSSGIHLLKTKMEEKRDTGAKYILSKIDLTAPEDQSLVGNSIIELPLVTETGLLKTDSRYDETVDESGERATWGGQLEFLLTCIAAAHIELYHASREKVQNRGSSMRLTSFTWILAD
ncbi:hypothetical protein CHS0354_040914 [Potamilus streckersoni]|uniref:Uncharacterized protein n=1 Tax=Potamilus streckersoni TaxID=2493646 RepID=A0AAE0SLW9_9BIVA|nr:hypothetical protein CHS0354_040914 [Potamilus streckersoni]